METNNTTIRSVAQTQSDNWDKILDEYEKNIGIPQFSKLNTTEVEQYMQMSRNELEKLTPEDCAQMAYMLIVYSVYVQKCYNREIARAKWAAATLNQVIANEVGTYNKYSPYEERKHQAIRNNDHAENLNTILIHAQNRADRLLFISSGIKNTSDILLSLQKAKAGVKHNVG